MSKKSALVKPLQTVTVTALGFQTVSGLLLEDGATSITLKVRRPRTSKHEIVTIAKDENLISYYGTVGSEDMAQVVVRQAGTISYATGTVTVNEDKSITVETEGDHTTTFYPGPGLSIDIRGADASEAAE